MNKSFFWGSLLIILVAITLAYGAWRQVQAWLFQPINISYPVTLVVAPGSGMMVVAEKMVATGLTSNANALRYYARYKGYDKSIKAGEYSFFGDVTADTLLTKLVSGDVQSYTVTIPEGLRYEEFIDRLMAHPVMVGKSRPNFKQWGSGTEYTHPEGLLFPSTYHFIRSDNPSVVVKLAFDRQQQLLQELWQNKAPDLPYKTPYDALIMASIIEKETGLVSEMNNIAGVLVKRMQAGMRLQTDPTVIYGLGEAYDGNLTRQHLAQKTPYNTYVNIGLPPTPIALPSENAMRAALNPEVDDDLFFIARGDGSHAFAHSYGEHLENVRKYQLKR